jgi:RNA polymerase sigma-70 factor (ECF subfamily)
LSANSGLSIHAPDGEELEQLRAYLLRYAMLRLRDPALAEDAVQETLLSALDARSGYSGQSAYRTWVVGILKHKIIDMTRKSAREQPLATEKDESESDAIDALFDANGSWREMAPAWADPEKSFEDKKFWQALERCLESMPARTARVFMMREVMDRSSEEICKDLEISATNLWVILHRARLNLRECLNVNWFGGTAR